MATESIGIIDSCLVRGLELFVSGFNSLPLGWRLGVIRGGIALFLLCKPNYKRRAIEQIAASFPEQPAQWHRDVAARSWSVLARVIVDFFRGPFLPPDWFESHVEVVGLEETRQAAQQAGKPVLLAGGHIGSFDLLAHAVGYRYAKLAFVVRNAKSKAVSEWWRRMREGSGNATIPRGGAVRSMIRNLEQGQSVGILFDQNVKVDYAVFVPWFGRQAATTTGLGLVAVKTEVPVVLAALHWISDEQYRMTLEPLPVEPIYRSDMTTQEKIHAITELASSRLQEIIRKHPEQWFWMHRRWRTRPPTESKPGEEAAVSSQRSNEQSAAR